MLGVDFQRYDELKKSGGISMQKVGANAVVFLRKFHPNSGAELVPDMGPVDVQGLLKTREQQAQVLAGIDSFIADIKALGVDTAPKAAE